MFQRLLGVAAGVAVVGAKLQVARLPRDCSQVV